MKPRALLIHGLGSSPGGWWRVRGWLEDAGWQTETVALLGHGGREAASEYSLDAYVDDVRRATKAGRPYDLVVGHSLGGTVSTVIAADDPGWTRRLVLLDPVWYVPVDELAAVAADQASDLLLDAESLRAAKPHWDERDIAGKLTAIAEVDPAAVRRTFADADRWDVRDAARRILTPTLVLGGDPDVYTMLEPADGYDVSEDASEMEYRIVPGAAHSPHRDVPDATHALLFEWLDLRGDTVERRLISSGSTFEEQIGYSRAVVAGDWVFVSGTTGFDYATMTISDDIAEQTAQCLRNIGAALEEGGAAFANVVRVTYVLPDGGDFESCWPALREVFGDVRPAAMMIEAGLSDPRMKIEIEVTALKG